MAPDGHIKKMQAMQGSSQMDSLFTSAPTVSTMTPLEANVRRAEVEVTTTITKHNIPLSFADNLNPLFKEIFPDSEIAKAYSFCKTKNTCILNGTLKPHFEKELVDIMKEIHTAYYSMAQTILVMIK